MVLESITAEQAEAIQKRKEDAILEEFRQRTEGERSVMLENLILEASRHEVAYLRARWMIELLDCEHKSTIDPRRIYGD